VRGTKPVSRNGGVMCDQWTAERVSLLKELWANGATAEAIGAQLGGLSRSAVLGKIYRLRRGGKSRAAPKARPNGPRSKQDEPPPEAPRTELKHLLDLTNQCCRWPIVRRGVRGIFFCGAPEADLASGVPYCPYHARRAYVIPPKRKPKAALAHVQSAASPRRRRYVWRAPVRHPAARFR